MKTIATLGWKEEEEQGDEVRWERVARLKAAIEAGTYDVSSEALAERLMELTRRRGLQGRVGVDL